ncbi:MAG: hypothetical protein RRX93_07740 [Bacteroidales bacterium]
MYPSKIIKKNYTILRNIQVFIISFILLLLIFMVHSAFGQRNSPLDQTFSSTEEKQSIQENSLKAKALDEFKKEHYTEAIHLLEKALTFCSNDAEIYFYLGWFNHYRAYDSRPLNGYNYSYSKKIFNYLDKAISLNPNYGDAKYFYGAECSGNAFLAMQNQDAEQLKYFYDLAYKKGAYPDWLIEFGENILNSCDKNAILFTGGNADFDICTYLQLCQKFRTDITIIPIGNIDRPWYVQFLKRGLKACVKKVNINLTDQQIMDIHPYKWDTTTVNINVSEKDKRRFGLKPEHTLSWIVKPDLVSDRLQFKIMGETAKERRYLSPQRAILLQIVEDNFSERPIYFSNFVTTAFLGGLNDFFQNGGLVSKLLPIKTIGTDYEVNLSMLEKLLQKENFQNYIHIKNTDIPRISKPICIGYCNAFLMVQNYWKEDNLKKWIDCYKSKIQINFQPEIEQEVLNLLESNINH